MNDLQKQVRLAQRRLLIQELLSIVPWTLTGALFLAAIAIGLTKVMPLSVANPAWTWGWIGGAVLIGLVVAGWLTYRRRASAIQAAIEIDQRCGLKERVSSCLSLDADALSTEAGQALMHDALRRVANVDVAQQFKVTPSRWAWLPLVAAVVTFGLTFFSDARPDSATKAQAATVKIEQRVLNSTENLKKKLEERRKRAIERGLTDAGDLFKKLEQGVESLNKKEDVDRQDALVKLNDLAHDLQQRQKDLLSRDDLRKQLNMLKDIKQGPADRLAKAMKQGDFKTALDELKQLQEQLTKAELSDEEKKQLQAQLGEMQEKMQQLTSAHREAQQQLKRQIEQKLAQGDRQAAGELQKKLEQLQLSSKQMNQLDKLAQKLGECSQCMQAGEMQQAAAALEQMAGSLEGMQQELAEMQMLEEAMNQIAMAKEAMSCQNCNGLGCSQCQGDLMGMGTGMGNGMGMGEGEGQGDRPEEETGTGFYDSQVRTKPGQGRRRRNRPRLRTQSLRSGSRRNQGGDRGRTTGQRRSSHRPAPSSAPTGTNAGVFRFVSRRRVTNRLTHSGLTALIARTHRGRHLVPFAPKCIARLPQIPCRRGSGRASSRRFSPY